MLDVDKKQHSAEVPLLGNVGNMRENNYLLLDGAPFRHPLATRPHAAFCLFLLSYVNFMSPAILRNFQGTSSRIRHSCWQCLPQPKDLLGNPMDFCIPPRPIDENAYLPAIQPCFCVYFSWYAE